MNQKDLNDCQQKWVGRIQAYNFDIEYVKGTNNVVADALSRQYHINTITSYSQDWKRDIIVEYTKDPQTRRIMEGDPPSDEYKIVEELIFYKGRIFLAENAKGKGILWRNTMITPYQDT